MRLAEQLAARTALPEWTLLAMSYLMSGAVVWVVRAFFVDAG